MLLYFTCPAKNDHFSTTDFTLDKEYVVIETPEGGRELKGSVSLNSPCPLCGGEHRYEVKDVMCTIRGGENE
jgi:hypothetical protein